MKIQNLFESSRQEVFEDYILLNTLYSSLNEAKREEFKKYYATVKGKPKAAKYFIEYKMTTTQRNNFYHDNSDDLKRVTFSGEFIDDTYSLGFTIYVYDLGGPPPFKFKRNDEIYDFGVFDNCSTLTEYPTWFPNHIGRYHQVGTSIKSLKNIHKVIESCGDMYFGKNESFKNASYLAEVKNLDNVEFTGNLKVSDVVNTYLKNTDYKDRSIFDLQDHLIESGFEEYA